jgi:outer membrane protein
MAAFVCAVLAGCGTAARLTRPEGDGGWTSEQRRDEVARAATVAEPSPGGPLTLASALAIAERGNRRIAEAEEGLEAARGRVWQSRAALLPSTTGAGRYTWYSDPLTTNVVLPPGLLPAGVTPPVVVVRESKVGNVGGLLTVPVDVSGELRHALAAVQAGYRGESARVWATRLEQQLAVTRSYFDLLAAKRLLDVNTQTIALQRDQLAIARARFESGRVTRNEVLVVEVALRNAEQNRLTAELGIDRARWELNDAIGIAVDAPSEVVDVQARPAVPTADEALDLARANNPVLVSLLEEQQRLDETVESLERGWLPRVAGGATIDYNTQTILQPQRIGSGFVGFTWDLGTDGRRAGEIAEAAAGARRARLALEDQLRGLEAAVRHLQRATTERLAALDAAEASVLQAEENLRIRREQFTAGRATSDDVLDADNLLTRERATLAVALYQAHTRRAELQELIGLPLDALAQAPE